MNTITICFTVQKPTVPWFKESVISALGLNALHQNQLLVREINNSRTNEHSTGLAVCYIPGVGGNSVSF